MKALSLTLAITALVAIAASTSASAQSAASRLEAREAKIEHRYAASRRNGSVTYFEGLRVRRQLASYRALKQAYSRDGKLTRQERRLLSQKLRATGASLHASRTNGRHRSALLPQVGR